MPKRIQRLRLRGWRMPPNAMSITRPGRYGNPYRIGDRFKSPFTGEFVITRENCLSAFETYTKGRLAMEPDWLDPLIDKDLACFCRVTDPCHGDIILRLLHERTRH